MLNIRNTKWLPALMSLTIIAIAAFQLYWLQKAYEREERTLEMRSNFLFRETVFSLQETKLKLDKLMGDSNATVKVLGEPQAVHSGSTRVTPNQKVASIVDVLIRKAKDSTGNALIIRGEDTVRMFKRSMAGKRNRLMQFLFDVDSLQDSVRVREIELAYAERLKEQNLNVPFHIRRVPTVERENPVFNEVTLGVYAPDHL